MTIKDELLNAVGWRANRVSIFTKRLNFIDLIGGSCCSQVHPSSLVGQPAIICHLDNSQTNPSQNTQAAQLTGLPWGWETETGSHCCGKGRPSLQRCVWPLCWWRYNAGRLPARTWGWKTEESSLEGCITGSYGERERDREKEGRGLQWITWEYDLRINHFFINQTYPLFNTEWQLCL